MPTVPLPLVGGCQCGTCRYAIGEQPLTLYACHCTECQHQSGGAFGTSLVVPRAGFAFTAGVPATWRRTAASGRAVACAFCPTCGTRLAHFPTRNDAVVNVKSGTLDDTRWVRPVGHLWTQSAQPWIELSVDALVYAKQPDDFSALVAAWAAAGD